MSGNKTVYRFTDWAMLIGLSIMWGFSFFFIKKGLEAFSPYQVGALRISIAFFTLLPILPFYWKKLPTRLYFFIFITGLLGSGLPPFLFAIAETHISSSVAGILNSTTPLFALTFGVFLFGLKATWKKFGGVFLGMLGAIAIISSRIEGSVQFQPAYALLVVAATACYGLSANILKSKVLSQPHAHPVLVSVLGFCFLGPLATSYLVYSGVPNKLLHEPAAQQSILYLLILGVFGTGIAILFFNTLTKRTSALFASYTTYLIPVVAVIVGVFNHESLNFSQILGFAVIITGIILSNRS